MQLKLFTEIIDETEKEVLSFKYEITSYGADYPIDSLIKRLRKGSIFVPPFQRRYVWNKEEASKFIESLLLGLPVPGIFLSKEKKSKKLLIVDGQQRLLTLLYYYNTVFKDQSEFRLVSVQEDMLGKTYNDLASDDQNRLDDSILHATVIKQDEPDDGDSSIYQIFERINSGGRPLSPQEIRACIYYGTYNEFLVDLATENECWRDIIGGDHNDRLKEEELILRYFSLLTNLDTYKKPMKEFLNTCMSSNRDFELISKESLRKDFNVTISFIHETLGEKAFRLERGVLSAIFDAIMIATTRRLREGDIVDKREFVSCYNSLLKDKEFRKFYTSNTSDDNSVKNRIHIATEMFSKLS